jgi:hypothetical protein
VILERSSSRQKKPLQEMKTLTPNPAKFQERFKTHSCPALVDYLCMFVICRWKLKGTVDSSEAEREQAETT